MGILESPEGWHEFESASDFYLRVVKPQLKKVNTHGQMFGTETFARELGCESPVKVCRFFEVPKVGNDKFYASGRDLRRVTAHVDKQMGGTLLAELDEGFGELDTSRIRSLEEFYAVCNEYEAWEKEAYRVMNSSRGKTTSMAHPIGTFNPD